MSANSESWLAVESLSNFASLTQALSAFLSVRWGLPIESQGDLLDIQRISTLNGEFVRFRDWCLDRGCPMAGKDSVSAMFGFVKHRITTMERPEGFFKSFRSLGKILARFTGQDSPAHDTFLQRSLVQIITDATKCPMSITPVVDVVRLLTWIKRNWADNQRLSLKDLRSKVFILLGLIRLARPGSLAGALRPSTAELDQTGIPITFWGDKTDLWKKGSTRTVWPSSIPTLDPVAAIKVWCTRTEGPALIWAHQHPGQRTPLFLSLKTPRRSVGSATVSKCIVRVFELAGCHRTQCDKKVPAKALRKSGRQLGLDAGFDRLSLDWLGNWALSAVTARHYTDWKVPRSWSDVVLCSAQLDSSLVGTVHQMVCQDQDQHATSLGSNRSLASRWPTGPDVVNSVSGMSGPASSRLVDEGASASGNSRFVHSTSLSE